MTGLWHEANIRTKSSFGSWRAHGRAGRLGPSSAKIVDIVDRGGACFNDTRVEVVRIVDASWRDQKVTLYVPTPVEKSDIVH